MRNNEKKNLLMGMAILLFVTTSGMASASGIEKIFTGYTVADNTVRAYITAQKVDNIGEVQLSLTYDPKVMTANNVDKGGLLSSSANFTSNIDNDAGNIQINITGPDVISGDGSLAIITFKSIGSDGETSPLDIGLDKVTDSANNDVDLSMINISNAVFTVGNTATSTPTETVTETATEQPTETIEQPTETPTETPPETTVPTETTSKPSPGFEGIMSIMAIIATLAIIYRHR